MDPCFCPASERQNSEFVLAARALTERFSARGFPYSRSTYRAFGWAGAWVPLEFSRQVLGTVQQQTLSPVIQSTGKVYPCRISRTPGQYRSVRVRASDNSTRAIEFFVMKIIRKPQGGRSSASRGKERQLWGTPPVTAGSPKSTGVSSRPERSPSSTL